MITRWTMFFPAVLIALAAGPASAVLLLEDGQYHTIDSYQGDEVIVRSGPLGEVTTLEILPGGDVDADVLSTDNSILLISGGTLGERVGVAVTSLATISGGTVDDLAAFDDANVDIYGGSVRIIKTADNSKLDIYGGITGEIEAHGDSTVAVHGGAIGYIVAVTNSYVTITGGTIEGLVTAYDSAFVTIDADETTVDVVWAADNSHIAIADGTVDYVFSFASVTITGGTIGGELSADDGTITLYGRDFVVDGQSYPDGGTFRDDTGGLGERTGTLTATLISGDLMTTSFKISGDGEIILVPEPATMSLLAFGGLALLRKKRK